MWRIMTTMTSRLYAKVRNKNSARDEEVFDSAYGDMNLEELSRENLQQCNGEILQGLVATEAQKLVKAEGDVSCRTKKSRDESHTGNKMQRESAKRANANIRDIKYCWVGDGESSKQTNARKRKRSAYRTPPRRSKALATGTTREKSHESEDNQNN